MLWEPGSGWEGDVKGVRAGRWAGLTEELQTKTRNPGSKRREGVSLSQDIRPSGTGGNVITGKGGLGEETV